MKIDKIAYSLLIFLAIGYILVIGKPILLPFVVALIIWFLIKAVRDFVSGFRIGRIKLPYWFQTALVFIIIFGSLSLVGHFLLTNITKMKMTLPAYKPNINVLLNSIYDQFDIDLILVYKDYGIADELTARLKNLLVAFQSIMGQAVFVFFYVVFLLVEEKAFVRKLRMAFSTTEDYNRFSETLDELNNSINHYILIKAFVGLLIAGFSFIALLLIGIDFPFFWAFVIFLLNFIPTIGPLITVVFLSLAVILQTGEIRPLLWVVFSIGAIQTLIANIIEPKLMGSNLNISILVILLALVLWGSIWGVIGMLLCVPITVIMIKVFSLFRGTRVAAIMLSENGEID